MNFRSNRILLTIGLLGGLIFLTAITFRWPFVQIASKPFPMLCLMLWLSTFPPSAYRRWIFYGFLFSLGGDILLEMQAVLPAWKAQWFLAGLVSFLLGHLCYVAAYLRDDRSLAIVPAIPAFAFGISVYLFLLPGIAAQKMVIPVAIYVLVISSMLWRAAARRASPGISSFSATAGLVGASLFLLSDSIIAIDKFYAPFDAARYLIILLYWAGQVGIAASALGRQADPHPTSDAPSL